MIASKRLELPSSKLTLRETRALADSGNANTKTLLLGILEQKAGNFVEPDAEIRAEAEKSLYAVQSKLSTGEMIGRVFLSPVAGSWLFWSHDYRGRVRYRLAPSLW